MNDVYFANVRVKRLEQGETLPAKFQRMLDRLNLAKTVKGRRVCVKMHLGNGLGYTTLHPLFVRLLVDKIKEAGAKHVFVADANTDGCEKRGYTRESLGCGIVNLFRDNGPRARAMPIGFKRALIAREILDSEALHKLSCPISWPAWASGGRNTILSGLSKMPALNRHNA